MSKVTSKLQVTLPKAIAERYGIRPGDDIQWMPAGEIIRVVPARKTGETEDVNNRLRLFDLATERIGVVPQRFEDGEQDRGWTREDLYERGRSR